MAGRVLPCCITVTTILIVILFACCPVVSASHTRCSVEGEIRLADGPSSREGRVDICVDRRWLTPCQDFWGIEETQVVCRELGFCQQGGSLVTGQSYQNYIPNYINEVNCTGDEATLSNCSVTYSSNCGSYIGAGVSCNLTQPNIPTNVEITFIDSHSIRVTWSPPDMSNCVNVDEYKIYCFDYTYCGNSYNLRENTPSHSSSVTLYDPYDNDNFNSCTFFCCVSGNNSAGEGPQYCMRGPRPTPLRNVTVQPSQTSLLIEWMEPEQVYGQFNFYIVVCGTQTRPGVSSRIVYSITETAVNFTRLSVFTRYECCVRVFNYNFIDSIPNCVNATTAPDLPTTPLVVNITDITYKSIQLEWSRPQPINGIISHYTITCLQADGTFVSLNTTADGLETVSNLQPLTNYTCCISATNQVGEGNDTCVDARTERGPPTEPQEVAIVTTYTTSLVLTWREPAESYGQAILFYGINCTSALHSLSMERVHYDTTLVVDGLEAYTNYTCCVSATSQIGKGKESCADTKTKSAPPSEPEDIVISVSTGNDSPITLTWTEPAESYGQAISFYSINCTSAHHNAEIQRAYTTSVGVSGLISNTNYTCCVSARNSVGVELHQCIVVMTAISTEQPQIDSILVTAVSAGALLAVLLLLCIVITCITCCCCYKRRTSKQVTLQGQQSTADPVYDVPEDIELKEKGSTLRSGPQNNDTSRRHVYKEEVEIRYEKPVLASSGGIATNKKQKEKKPMMLIASPSITQPGQQSSEKIYQPLIPPKTYKEQEVSAYQDLAFETRDAGTDVANNSEGQYEPIRKNDDDNQYEPLSFGGGGTSQEEGAYQPLSFQTEDDNTYETIQTTTTRT